VTARRAAAAWLAVAAYAALIFWLSSRPDPLPELSARVWDKAAHFLAYGGLGFLLLLAVRASGAAPGRAAVLAALLTSAYGVSDEVHQAFVPLRQADPRDWLADTVGGAAGVAAAALALRVAGSRASIRRLP
jgi:VanZ family protein